MSDLDRAHQAAAKAARRYVVEMNNPSSKHLVATEFLAEEMIAAYLDSLLEGLPEPRDLLDHDPVMAAIAAHRKRNQAAYQGVGLTVAEEVAMRDGLLAFLRSLRTGLGDG